MKVSEEVSLVIVAILRQFLGLEVADSGKSLLSRSDEDQILLKWQMAFS